MDIATEQRVKEVTEMQNVRTPMPRYSCHKKVYALKIAAIELVDVEGELGAILTPAAPPHGFAAFFVTKGYVAKHNPQPGGYFVVYDDGYQSFSPAKAFEEGYTRI